MVQHHVTAAAVLATSHAIANIVGGCACICCSGDKLRRSSPNRLMASFALVLTWMVVIVGLAPLILGALPNSKKSMAQCGVVRHNFLSIGDILCFVHALFCLVYYVSVNAAAQEEGGRGSKGVGVHT